MNKQVDQICESFEEGWRSGTANSVEEMLDQVPLSQHSDSLVLELIATEMELRRQRGADPGVEEYLVRFPQCAQQIPDLIRPALAFQDLSDSKNDPAEMPDSIDLPGYEILDELGRGSMGVVYKAHDKQLNRFVALKFIHHRPRPARVSKSHFHREARTIARLRHPGIVQIYGLGDYDGHFYLILELISGCSLNQWLNGAPLSPRWSATIIARIAQALDYAHSQGVIHRDLKPANILLAPPDGSERHCSTGGHALWQEDVPNPVITDFGLAKQLFSSDTISGHGALFGTPSYMPPEQAEGRSFDATPASDVYALGANLYEMLTGRPPFQGDTQLETLRKVCRETPVAVRSLQPNVDSELEDVCLRCLEKSPERRYQTAMALAEALEDCLAKVPFSAERGTLGMPRLGTPGVQFGNAGQSGVGSQRTHRRAA